MTRFIRISYPVDTPGGVERAKLACLHAGIAAANVYRLKDNDEAQSTGEYFFADSGDIVAPGKDPAP